MLLSWVVLGSLASEGVLGECSLIYLCECNLIFYVTLYCQFFYWLSSAVRAHLFFREEEWETFKQIYDTYLFEAARVCFNLLIGFLSNGFDNTVSLHPLMV